MPIGVYDHEKVRFPMKGKTFNYYRVLELAQTPEGKKGAYWLCECKCGVRKIVNGSALRKGTTKSCGCYNREAIREARKKARKLNPWERSDAEIIVTASNGGIFKCSPDDWEKARQHTWLIDNLGYPYCVISGKKIRFHRFVLDVPKGCVVDHVDRDKSNNVRENLRIVTQLVNAQNTGVRSTNTSGYPGVYWNKSRKKWEARLIYNGERFLLGCFSDKEDAIAARKKKECELNWAGRENTDELH